MKKNNIYTLFFCLCCLQAQYIFGQNKQVDSLKVAISSSKNDTSKIKMYLQLCELLEGDEVVKYAGIVLQETEKKLPTLKDKKVLRNFYLKQFAAAYDNIGRTQLQSGKFQLAAQTYVKSLQALEDGGFKYEFGVTLRNIGVCYDGERNVKMTLEFYKKALKVFEDLNDKKEVGLTLNYIGGVYHNQDDIPSALQYYNQALAFYEAVNYKEGVAYLSNDLAYINQNNGDIKKAVEYYLKALKIYEEVDNRKGVANSLAYLAEIYYKQDEYAKAIEYYNKSLSISNKINYKHGIGLASANLGSVYHSMGDTAKALDFYHKALEVQKLTGDVDGIPSTLKKIGSIHYQKGNYKEALTCFDTALAAFKKINARHGIAATLHSIALLQYKKGNIDKALENATMSLNVAMELGYPLSIIEPSKLLKDIYGAKNNNSKAYEMYGLYISMRDSINNETTKKAGLRSYLKYEYEKKAAADSVKVVEEKKLAGVKLKEARTKSFALYIGLFLTAVFAVFMFNRLRLAKKQKNIIEEQKNSVEFQKNLVEEKQKEILDSIRYAKRIQDSLLPNEKYIIFTLDRLAK